MPTKTIEERRAAIVGWVYSPYRMNDLMDGILGHWDRRDNNRINLEVKFSLVSNSNLGESVQITINNN
jgi:hypothetical protein